MPKTSIQEVRRRELIEGAYRVFLEHGIAGLTTQRICREAGMSPGLLVYYFKGKDDVLFWMTRHANRQIMDAAVAGMSVAATQWDRLRAIIAGNFTDDLFNRNTANAWVSFYAITAQHPQLERLQLLFHRRLASNLRSCVRGVLGPGETADFVRGVGILLDGCWLRKGMSNADLTSADAIGLIEDYMASFIGADRVARLRTLPAADFRTDGSERADRQPSTARRRAS